VRSRDRPVVGASVRSYGRAMTAKPLIPLLAVALLAGCGSERSDRAGGDTAVKAKVLVMANAQYFPDELTAFRDAVERVSGGRLRIKLINQYGSGRKGNSEVNLIRDISAGKADLGWAATRIFDELGVAEFNPLHAPMLIESYALEEKVLTDDLVDPMLDSLGELGLRGVGILPGPMRRPFGKDPLVALDDWAGASIGSSGGEQVGKALRSLGARRELEFSAEDTSRVDGLDTHVASVLPNRYQRSIPYLTGNVVLWARPLVVFAGPDVSADDLAVLREAAKSAVPQVLELSRKLESDGLSEICRSGLQVVAASPPQIDALRAAFEPVYADLERDAAASRAVARIHELAQEGGGVDTLRCPDAATAAAGTTPLGTYRTVVTRADIDKYGLSWAEFVRGGPDPEAVKANAIEFRLEFTEQGTFTVGPVLRSGKFADDDGNGTYSIYRDRMTLHFADGNVITMRVQRDGNRLRFADLEAPGRPFPPWRQTFVKID
jgi:TRAP-type C4-dicarboxylate transport system substrate-binding protein